MAYHYTESGLDNVYLVNGYKTHETAYGTGISIQNTDGLHRAIGQWLIDLPKALNGAELRFLRIELDMTQRNLGAVLGTTEQTLRLWEKNRRKAIPGSADRLLRALYAEYTGGDGSIRRMVERLAALNQVEAVKLCMSEDNDHWVSQTMAA